MKLARLRDGDSIRPVIVTDDAVLDASALADDITPAFLAGGGIAAVADALGAGQLPTIDVSDLAYDAPIARPGKIVCIGLNYRDHAEESGMPIPDEPVVFMKATNTIVGPDDDVLIPRRSQKTDYEVELAVVIGATARYLGSPADAMATVAGYAVSNDVSEREFQLERGGQWDKGKSCETFNPLGPWLVTADDVPDPQALGLRLWVNGELRQDGKTSQMIFDVSHIVWYLSQFMVLDPGDVVNTGTPAGVAVGSDDIPYLAAGDVVDLEIDGLGRQRQRLVQA